MREAVLFLGAKSGCGFLLSVSRSRSLDRACLGLGHSLEQKELEPLVQLWVAVISREEKRQSLALVIPECTGT